MTLANEITLSAHDFTLGVSLQGGFISQCRYQGQPIMRDYSASNRTAGVGDSALGSSSYPLVPFGNRIADNCYIYDGEQQVFTPNHPISDWVIHGSGWQQDWDILKRSQSELLLTLANGVIGNYRYTAEQRFLLELDQLIIEMSVTNKADSTMLFGLGFHPFFYRSEGMTLQANSRHYWTEQKLLPHEKMPVTPEIDFNQPNLLPESGIDNAFEGWDGKATLTWPERAWGLAIETAPSAEYFHLFTPPKPGQSGVPETEIPSFCFEPMTHLANGFHYPDANYAGLKALASGEKMSMLMRLKVI
jgi:aldose 1-epimerase